MDPVTETNNSQLAHARRTQARQRATDERERRPYRRTKPWSGNRLEVPEPEPGQRRAYRIQELCRAYRIGENTARKLMKEGRLVYTRVGKLLLISADSAENLFNPK